MDKATVLFVLLCLGPTVMLGAVIFVALLTGGNPIEEEPLED